MVTIKIYSKSVSVEGHGKIIDFTV